ncbi:MAG: hypothetical protein LBG62_02270 [Candidatus Methanoplasma sp.]|jgi:hypothetical protein|nr:hypothetical protein [Candidatus Methanoplasma sp.]
MNGYYEAMRAKGFSYETTASVRKFACPGCGFMFSLVYARAFACQGCSEAARGCPKVRCGRCDMEFFMSQAPDIGGKGAQRAVSDHICRIVNRRNEDLGVSGRTR